MKRRMTTRLGAIFAAMALSVPAALASDYPDRPITLVVPYSAGGPLDLTARIVGDHMSKTLKQPVVVENITGGGGGIATARVARAAPNGYMLLIQQPALAANVTLMPTPGLDIEKALTGIAIANESPMLILASKKINTPDMKAAVAWMKKNDNNIRFSHAGVGSLSHLCATMFANAVGVSATMIPYRGGTPAIADTMAGHADLYCSSAQLAIPQIQGDTLTGLAVTADNRAPSVKAVPTTAEAGFDSVKATFWQAFFAPAETPKPVLDKLNEAIRLALADPNVQAQFEKAGMTATPVALQTPEATNKLLSSEIKKWGDVIRKSGMQAAPQ